jgi:hypothetical protein
MSCVFETAEDCVPQVMSVMCTYLILGETLSVMVQSAHIAYHEFRRYELENYFSSLHLNVVQGCMELVRIFGMRLN